MPTIGLEKRKVDEFEGGGGYGCFLLLAAASKKVSQTFALEKLMPLASDLGLKIMDL